jgi:hypothetical protein
MVIMDHSWSIPEFKVLRHHRTGKPFDLSVADLSHFPVLQGSYANGPAALSFE